MRLYLKKSLAPRLTLEPQPHVPLVLALPDVHKGLPPDDIEPVDKGKKGQQDLSAILDSLMSQLPGEELKKDA